MYVLAYEMNKFLLDSKTFLNNCRMKKPVSIGNVNLWNIEQFHLKKYCLNSKYLSLQYSHLSNKRGVHAYWFWKIPPSTNQKSTLHVYWILRFFHPPRLFQLPHFAQMVYFLRKSCLLFFLVFIPFDFFLSRNCWG